MVFYLNKKIASANVMFALAAPRLTGFNRRVKLGYLKAPVVSGRKYTVQMTKRKRLVAFEAICTKSGQNEGFAIRIYSSNLAQALSKLMLNLPKRWAGQVLISSDESFSSFIIENGSAIESKVLN